MADDRNYSGVRDADYTGNEAGRSDYRSSSAWEYAAVDDDRNRTRSRGYSGQEFDRDRGRGFDRGYGDGGYGARYAQSSDGRGQGIGGGAYGDYGQGNSGIGQNYGQSRDRDYGSRTGGQGYGGQSYGAGSNYGTHLGYDRERADDGRQRDWNGNPQRGNFQQQGSSWDRGGGRNERDYGRDFDRDQARNFGRPEDRTFFDRAGDEVRSWFGDDEAQRRRERDQRYDEQRERSEGRDAPSPFGGHRDDNDYHHWRQQQIDALDRDYHEYRQENRDRFANEFGAFRTDRQGQRASLNQVEEHQEVLGADGAHVGTVDKVRGDRILLTKSDQDAGGRHHSVPSRWIQSVADNKVTLRKTADEAKAHWRDEERNSAFFGDDDGKRGTTRTATGTTDQSTTSGTTGAESTTDLNKSFSGTY